MFPTFYVPGASDYLPLALTLVNPGFESDAAPAALSTGWTNDTAATPRVVAASNLSTPWPGNQFLVGGMLGDPAMQIHQDIDLRVDPNYVPAYLIDAGLVQATAVWWGGTASTTTNGAPQLTLKYYSAAMALLGSSTAGVKTPVTAAGTYIPTSTAAEFDEWTDGPYAVPANTRIIRVQLNGTLGAGSGSDAMFDDIRVTLTRA